MTKIKSIDLTNLDCHYKITGSEVKGVRGKPARLTVFFIMRHRAAPLEADTADLFLEEVWNRKRI